MQPGAWWLLAQSFLSAAKVLNEEATSAHAEMQHNTPRVFDARIPRRTEDGVRVSRSLAALIEKAEPVYRKFEDLIKTTGSHE